MGLRVGRWVGQMVGLRVGQTEDPRVDRTVGWMEDRLEGLRGDPTVVLKGGLREDQSEGQMVVRWVEQMAGLREDQSVVMKGALVVPMVEAEAEWLPSQQEVRVAKAVLLPRAVQQGLVRLVA